jgi:hypothetical protein
LLLLFALGCAEAGKGGSPVIQSQLDSGTGSPDTDLGEPSETLELDDSKAQEVAQEEFIAVSGKSLNILGEDPVEGLDVCVFERVDLPCGKSGEDGIYTVPKVPANAEVSLAYTQEGFFPELIMVKTGSEDLMLPITSAHATQDQAQLILQLVEQTEDTKRGHLGLGVFRQNTNDTFVEMIEGISFELDPPSDSKAVYLRDNGLPDPQRTETSVNARAFIFNVEPGEVVVSVTHNYWKNCGVGGFGWPSEGKAAIRLRVVPGYVSAGVFLCVNPR